MDGRRQARERHQKGRGYLGLWNSPAGPLLGGDGFDDELPAIFRTIRRNDFLPRRLSKDGRAC